MLWKIVNKVMRISDGWSGDKFSVLCRTIRVGFI